MQKEKKEQLEEEKKRSEEKQKKHQERVRMAQDLEIELFGRICSGTK